MIHDPVHGVTATGVAPLSRGPQPGWMTLNEAREHAFTGEIVFETEPETHAYLDNGVVYYAEHSNDAPLSQRLIDAGLVDHVQLERGTVRVGEVEHLGRLFDRDPSVDRDAVLVVTEVASEQIIAELANHTIATIRCTAYRHHPSGLHRWFVTPVDVAAARTSGMAPLDAGVLGDIPGLPVSTGQGLADQLYIEWDEPMLNGAFVDDESLIDSDDRFVDDFDDSLLQSILDDSYAELDDHRQQHSDDMADELADDRAEDRFVDAAPVVDDVHLDVVDGPIDRFDNDELPPDGFQVMWPNGAVDSPVDVVSTPAEPDAETDRVVAEDPLDVVIDDTVEQEEVIVAEVPDDVAESVRRAIAALELAAPTAPTSATPPTASSAFAPPSLDTSAEAMYARMVGATVEETPYDVAVESSEIQHAEFASPEPSDDGGSNERSSALRRLIGSLKRKDR